ncbi:MULTISPECIES: GntR family transcriptional regulator [unclassified Paenibacillus]|uniref:GntR family transcriptional regulator n=1 Tax=unclassified Paenibacillus TaxID=185978 RepID=UPI001AEA17CB|nr:MULTISPECIES: GntR family transcriptional regulator [unclassified Paenibacillus]MBP1154979.1 DNA-binding GntR family transcriptional regulator [Paenibacillus sp. PvP091]MBP1169637.1 DNA-binding GntR family transcriptional regulator [Paenibacillus sp. PvR098]MBP2440665.1 DNA-binding GntR family transcriptional regulator [Paenibacillus sp. PvP052]
MISDFSPLPKQGLTVASQVAEVLQEAILKGEIKPGDRVFQDNVAKQLGVSRIPVRLAFEMLQSRGLLILNPHKGATVTQLSVEEMREVFAFRAYIEGVAIEKSLPKLTEEDLEQAQRTIRKMQQVEDTNEWLKLNRMFHGILYSRFQSSVFNEVIQMLRANTERYVRISLSFANRFKEYDREHEDILEACYQRDVERAKALIITHLGNTVSTLENLNENKKIFQD